jgi:hypothetical protein
MVLLKTRDEFNILIQQIIDESNTVAEVYPHHANHRTLAWVLTNEPHIQDVLYLAWQKNDMGAKDKVQKLFTYESIQQVFRNFGFGEIDRFHPDQDMEVYYNGRDTGMFMNNICLFILREKMMCCAVKNCGDPITNTVWGAIGYDHDHVMDNDRKQGEARTKRAAKVPWLVLPLMVMLKELAKTQLKCKTCHLLVTSASAKNHKGSREKGV